MPLRVRARQRIHWLELSRYAGGQSGATTYLLHGEKDYTQAGYLAVSDGHLWIQRIDGALRLLDGAVGRSDEDRKGSTFRDPFGVLAISRRRFWIVQRNGWEDEAYEIVEVLPHRIQRILTVYGGGC